MLHIGWHENYISRPELNPLLAHKNISLPRMYKLLVLPGMIMDWYVAARRQFKNAHAKVISPIRFPDYHPPDYSLGRAGKRLSFSL